MDMKFANYLTHLINQSGMKKKEIASRMNVSLTYIVHISKHYDPPPTLERCEQLAKILKADDQERKKLLQLAHEERMKPNDLAFQQAIDVPFEKLSMTKEVAEALLNPVAVKALLMTHKVDKKSAKAMEEIVEALKNMDPGKVQALLQIIR